MAFPTLLTLIVFVDKAGSCFGKFAAKAINHSQADWVLWLQIMAVLCLGHVLAFLLVAIEPDILHSPLDKGMSQCLRSMCASKANYQQSP